MYPFQYLFHRKGLTISTIKLLIYLWYCMSQNFFIKFFVHSQSQLFTFYYISLISNSFTVNHQTIHIKNYCFYHRIPPYLSPINTVFPKKQNHDSIIFLISWLQHTIIFCQLICHIAWLPLSSLVTINWSSISCFSSVTWEIIPISLEPPAIS